jgi:type I restriction enzyme R subunit
MSEDEREWHTRKRRIDPRLDARGWHLPKAGTLQIAYRSEEDETENGPADYALWFDNHFEAVVEAKKLTIGPQNVLAQAERYARGLKRGRYNFDGLRAPFLYSTNGEVIWFHDVRHPLNRSRRIADFHTPNAVRELLNRDFGSATDHLHTTPNEHPFLRPYQREANAAMEQAIADRKRQMLATSTGKTLTMVNQIYHLMKSR